MSEIRALGYVGVRARNLDDWVSFATGLLGLQVADRAGSTVSFRMDEQRQRLVVQAGDDGGAAFFGWEVADAAALDALASRLEKNGVPVKRAARALAEERGVKDLAIFEDPAGNRLEIYYGAATASAAFKPGRAVSGFVTGTLGMGHAVLTVERIEAAMPFYQNLLGFQLSDYVLRPFKAYFFHVNPRHHSLALLETGRNGMHHLMLELCSLDDVGQGYDLALGEPERIATTLGRHTNDFVTSFYAATPSDFIMEYGWGGRWIDDGTWKTEEVTGGPSLWGHDRLWLPEAARSEARHMRLELARAGVRQPVQVMPGNHAVTPTSRRE